VDWLHEHCARGRKTVFPAGGKRAAGLKDSSIEVNLEPRKNRPTSGPITTKKGLPDTHYPLLPENFLSEYV